MGAQGSGNGTRVPLNCDIWDLVDAGNARQNGAFTSLRFSCTIGSTCWNLSINR